MRNGINSLPRVTEIIAAAHLMPDYERYSNGNYLEKGTAVDVGCQLLFKGHKLEDLEVDPVILPELTSLDLWLKHTGFRAKRIQQEGVSMGLGFIGHWDVDGIWDAYYWLIDTKAAAKARWHRAQTAAYEHLARCQKIEIDRRGSLYLQKDGSMAKIVPHEDRADWGAFHSALKLWHGEKALDQYRENIKRWMEA